MDSEARFLSHHDTMRLMAQAGQRARLPMAYTGGFNPRPRLSLPLPRPVGIAGRSELLVLELAEPADAADAVGRLARQMPEELSLLGPTALPGRRAPQAEAADYELTIAPQAAAALADRLEELAGQPQWPCTRQDGHHAYRRLELRELVKGLAFDGRALSFTLAPQGQIWARVDEVLALLHLPATDRAGVTRTAIRWRPQGEDPGIPATNGTKD